MTVPSDLATTLVACALLLSALSGCSSENEGARQPATAQPAAAQLGAKPPPTRPPPAKPEPPSEAPVMRCVDFIGKKDVSKLGFDGSKYDEEGLLSYGNTALTCHVGPSTFQVFTDDRYKAGLRNVFDKQFQGSGLEAYGIRFVDGPKYGSDTLWMNLSGSSQVHFVSKSRKRSAAVTSTKRDVAEKLAGLLAKRIER